MRQISGESYQNFNLTDLYRTFLLYICQKNSTLVTCAFIL